MTLYAERRGNLSEDKQETGMTDFKALISDIARRINIEYDGGDVFSFEADGLVVSISHLPELDNGRIVLCRLLPLATLDADRLYAEVERFVNTVATWAKVVADYRGAAAEVPGEGSAEEIPATFGAGGFMQV